MRLPVQFIAECKALKERVRGAQGALGLAPTTAAMERLEAGMRKHKHPTAQLAACSALHYLARSQADDPEGHGVESIATKQRFLCAISAIKANRKNSDIAEAACWSLWAFCIRSTSTGPAAIAGVMGGVEAAASSLQVIKIYEFLHRASESVA